MTDFLHVENRKPMTAEERTVAIGVLRDARNKISPTGRRTQGFYARSSDGSVGVGDPSATCWCLRGSVRLMAPTHRSEVDALHLLLNQIETVAVKRSDVQVGLYNDTHTHLEVIALVDAAIERAEKRNREEEIA